MSDIRLGIAASAAFHVTLITVSIVGVPALMRAPPSLPEAIPVEIVDIDDVIRARKAAVAAEKQPDTKPKPRSKPEVQRQAKAVTPSVAPDAVPLPDAKPPKKIEPKPKVEIRPKDRITAANAPRSKPRPPSRVDTGMLAALIDRSVQDEEEERRRRIREEEEKQKRIEEAVKNAQVSQLEALRATGTIKTLIQQKMRGCWILPAGAKDASKHVISIRIFLSLDGTLTRPPILLGGPGLDTSDDNFYKIAAESALRAVRRCVPYPLPKDRYDQWRQIDLNFDPREMVGG